MLSEHDQIALKQAFDIWPERLAGYGHPEKEPGITRRLEEQGARIIGLVKGGKVDAPSLREFLIDVGGWKMPRDLESHRANVAKNDDTTILNVFRTLLGSEEDDERIKACTELAGFGRATGQTRMASAILRFLWPEVFGVIDWRNWAVLSNCGHTFLSVPLLPALAATPQALKDAQYDRENYIAYLQVLRKLRPALALDRVADVDLAIYSYSAEKWPFPRTNASPAVTEALLSRLDDEKQKRPQSLDLHEIYETYWDEWQKLGHLPMAEQRDLKVDFLWPCLEITPDDAKVWDQATMMTLPYRKKHKRDLEEVSRKIARWTPEKAVDELDRFMWSMRLRGEGLGVLSK